MPEEREGLLIYKEGVVQINAFPNDIEAHSVWIGDSYFLFQRGTLAELAERTPFSRIESFLDNYPKGSLDALKQVNVSPEQFALICTRARIKEEETYAQARICKK